MLLEAHDAGIKLKVINYGRIDWKFLELPDEGISRFKAAMKHLDYLHILLPTGWGYESRLTAPAELSECKEYLSKGDLVELALAAKDLRTLDIAFDGKFPQPAILKYVIKNAT